MDNSCPVCSYTATNKTNLKAHLKTEKHRRNQAFHDHIKKEAEKVTENLETNISAISRLETENKNLTDQRDGLTSLLEQTTLLLEQTKLQLEQTKLQLEQKTSLISQFEGKNKELENDNKNLTGQRDILKSLLERTLSKPAIVNNTTNSTTNNTVNNIVISDEPILYSTLNQKILHISTDELSKGDAKFGDTIMSLFLRDKEGVNKVVCTDLQRQNFQYRDEETGQILSDPELGKFKEAFIKSIKSHSELMEDIENIGEKDAPKSIRYTKRVYINNGVMKRIATKTYKKAAPVPSNK